MDPPEGIDEQVSVPTSLLDHISNVSVSEHYMDAIKNLVYDAQWFAERYVVARGLLEEALDNARMGLAPTFCTQCKNYWWVTHDSLKSFEEENKALCKKCNVEED